MMVARSALALLAFIAPTAVSVLIGRPPAPISPRAFVVSRALSAEARAASSNPCCVLVANVSWDVGVSELREAMEQRFGQVTDCWLAPAGSKRHKGLGRVTFKSLSSATAATVAAAWEWHGRTLRIRPNTVKSAAAAPRDAGTPRKRRSTLQGLRTRRSAALRKLRTSRTAVEVRRALRELGGLRDLPEYHMSILAHIRTGDHQAALAVFDLLRHRFVPDLPCRQAAMGATLKAVGACLSASPPQWERALNLYDAAVQARLEPSLVLSTLGMQAAAGAARPEKARGIWEQMLAQGLQPDARAATVFLRSLSASGDWRGVLAALAALPPRAIDTQTVNTALAACGAAGELGEAEQLLAGLPERGLRADIVSYNAVISAAEKAGKWERALTLFDEIRERGFVPTTVTYNAVISACGRGGQWRQALHFLDEMRAGPGSAPAADRISYNAALAACAREGEVGRALTLLREMEEQGVPPDITGLNAAIDACKQAGDGAEALRLLRSLRARGLVPDVATFTAAVGALAAAGHLGQGFALLGEAEAAGLGKQSYGMHHALLEACRWRDQAQLAQRVQARIDALQLAPVAPVATIRSSGAHGDEQIGYGSARGPLSDTLRDLSGGLRGMLKVAVS